MNHYDDTAKMGLHQDKEEVSRRAGGVDQPRRHVPVPVRQRRDAWKPYVDVHLESGDLVVFGGPSRFAYHGVPKVLPGTGDPAIGLSRGRLNITIRETGLVHTT